MDILYLLIPLSVVLAFLIGAVFWWAVRNGQFDDMEGPAHRILMDDDGAPPIERSQTHDALALSPSPSPTCGRGERRARH